MIFHNGRQRSALAAVFLCPLLCPLAAVGERDQPLPAISTEAERRAVALTEHYRAVSLESQLKLRPALESFERLLKVDPANPHAAVRAAALAAALNEPDRGLAIAEASLAVANNEPEQRMNLALYLHRYAPPDNEEPWRQRALQLVEELRADYPDRADVIDLLVDIRLASDETEQARAAVEKALLFPEGGAEYWLAMGDLAQKLWTDAPAEQGLVNRQRVDQAYRRAIKAAPDDFGVADRVANHHIERRQYKEAIKVLEPLVKKHPEQLIMREKLARVRGIDGDSVTALAEVRELVLAEPNEARTQRLLYELLASSGEAEEAVEHLERAVLLDGGDIDDYIELAVQLGDETEPPQPERALSLLERGRALFPKSARVAYMRAVVLGNMDRFEPALAAYVETEKLAKAYLPVLLDENFYFGAGSMAERSGNHAAASAHFEKAVQVVAEDEPERTAPALNYHGYMLLDTGGDLEKAGALIRRAVELKPDEPAYLDSLGWYYFKRKEYRKALVELRRAAELLGEDIDPEVHGHLVETYEALGQPEKAARYRDQLKELESAED